MVHEAVAAVDVMDLIEAGKLQLDSKVFGSGALLGTTYGTKAYSEGVKKITVRHLLQHFGYCVLGRVIEKVTGQTYENHVRLLLGGCGISRMEIGGDTLADRKPAEVVYQGGGAYNLRPRHMDAHGGWIATPIDLLRLMVRTDGFGAKTDILFANTEATMFSGAPANPGYGLGWIADNNYRGTTGR